VIEITLSKIAMIIMAVVAVSGGCFRATDESRLFADFERVRLAEVAETF